ncbi:MAG: GNAT family N-acetyltransferase [Anaerolineae bacterium]|nr:GNAT family N-acetyltransferase [Anaerolineae bacterium]
MYLPFDWTIRSAEPEDAAAIAGILHDCWPDDTPDIERITRLIRLGQHRTSCCWAGASCAGFVDAFRTISAEGSGRWEVDLLAVHENLRGLGIGTSLVLEAIETAPPDVDLARGLVRVGNVAAGLAFAMAGFHTEGVRLTLYTAAPLASKLALEAGHIVPVETFTYSGLWLEGVPSFGVLKAARIRAAALGVRQVGILVSAEYGEVCEAAGYAAEGVFRWWMRGL